PIPSVIWTRLAPFLAQTHHCSSKTTPLFLQAISPQLLEATRKTIAEINHAKRTRLTLHRVEHALFNMLIEHGGDIADACFITGREAPFGEQASRYYYSASVDHLRAMHQAALTRLLHSVGIKDPATQQQPAITGDTVGSPLCPDLGRLKLLVDDLRRLVEIRQQELGRLHAWIEFHNAFTVYCIAMTLFATGYRSVRDPIGKQTDIDWDTNFLVVADKDNDSFGHAKIGRAHV